LKSNSEIFFSNERQVTLLDTKHFGRIAYVEVGALLVGKIVQSHLRPDFSRGDEKGYFLFGGSTVIVLGEPGAWKPSADLLQRTREKQETLVLLGESVAERL
jgi:phosphatidylserine decarboxylase